METFTARSATKQGSDIESYFFSLYIYVEFIIQATNTLDRQGATSWALHNPLSPFVVAVRYDPSRWRYVHNAHKHILLVRNSWK